MNRRLTLLNASFVCAVATVAIAAAPQSLTTPALDEALRIARTRRPSELEQFTAPYIVARGGPGSPTVEVITEFRRAVMLARQQVDQGNHTWSPTNLSRAIAKYEGLTSVRSEVWLSPNHMNVGTPTYRQDLYTAAHRMAMPVEEKRDPIFAATTPDGSSAMTGVTLENIYRADVLREAGCCLVIVVDPNGGTVVKQQVEFANLR